LNQVRKPRFSRSTIRCILSCVLAALLLCLCAGVQAQAQSIPSGFSTTPTFDDEFSADSAVNTSLWGWRYDGQVQGYCTSTDNTTFPGAVSFMSDSTSAAGSEHITGYSASSNVVTLNAANNLLAGTTVTISGLSTAQGATFIGKRVVLATGLTTSQFQIALTTTNTSGTVSDSGYAVQNFARLYTFTSGGTNYCPVIYTGNTFKQAYGYWEAALRYGYQYGAQYAWWLQGNHMGNIIGNPQYSGEEVDIFEHTSWTTNTTAFDSNIYWNGYGSYEAKASYPSTPYAPLNDGNFHRFGLAWTPSSMTFYVDGIVYWTRTAAQAPISDSNVQYMILDTGLANGSLLSTYAAGYGALGASTNPYLDVAYVRVYPYAQATVQTTITPAADAYVGDSAPTTNYGTSTVMSVNSGATGSNDNAYLQFNLVSVPGIIQQATLYLTPTSVAGSSNVVNGLYSVSNNIWTESGLTWNNQPQSVTSSSTPYTTGTNYGADILTNYDVTTLAQSAQGATLSVEIATPCSSCTSGSLVQYASRQYTTNTAYQPSMMLVTTTGLAISPTTLAFGSQPQGVTSAPQAVTITNNGGAPIVFSSISPTVPFSQTNNCTPTLASGASCTVNVTFTPTSTTAYNGTLTLTSNDPGTTQTVALSGTGTSGPIPSLSPSSLSFGNVTVNTTSSSQAVTLSNSASAGAALTSISISITGTNASQFSQTNNCPTSLAVGTSCTINVSFTPSAAASASASLSVSDNYTSSPQTSTLSGTGTAIVPTITWNPSSTTGYTGAPIGSGVLDASASTAGTFAYTATPSGGSASSITASSGLSTATTYTLTANFTPTSNNYTTASATKTFTVVVQHVWVVNTSGSLGGLDDGGNAYISSATSGGGTGAAVDNSGNIWTINISGASLAKFSKTGTIVSSSFTGGGLSSAAALAIDGSNQVWVANGNGSLSLFNSSGVAQSPSTGFAPGALSTPTGIAIDNAGSLWVSNGGNNSVTEVIGAASPVITPTQAAVQNITLGVKP